MLLFAVISLISLFDCYHASYENDQQHCHNVKIMKNVDIQKLKGQWWEYQTYNTLNLNDPYDHDCLVANFYPKKDSVTVIEDYIKRVPGVNKEHARREWTFSWPDEYTVHEPNLGEFSGTFVTERGNGFEFKYYVIDTDYDSWLLANFCCRDVIQGTYVMTRNKTLDKSQVAEIEKKIRKAQGKFYDLESKRHAYITKQNANCEAVEFPENI